MLKTILISIFVTLGTITSFLGILSTLPAHKVPVEPVLAATQSTNTPTTTPYLRYLNFEPSAKPLVSTWNVCNKIHDIQGGGFTYLTTYKGQPTFSQVSCE